MLSENRPHYALKKALGKEIKEVCGLAKKGDIRRSCLDFSKIKKELHWEPRYSLEQGLQKTAEWFSRNLS